MMNDKHKCPHLYNKKKQIEGKDLHANLHAHVNLSNSRWISKKFPHI